MFVEIDHPNAITCWKAPGLDPAGNFGIAVVVETDLIVNEELGGFDSDKFGSLCEAVSKFLEENPNIGWATFHSLPEQEMKDHA